MVYSVNLNVESVISGSPRTVERDRHVNDSLAPVCDDEKVKNKFSGVEYLELLNWKH